MNGKNESKENMGIEGMMIVSEGKEEERGMKEN